MLVQKFGGGILSNAREIETVANIVKQAQPDLVVVSALNEVTNQLIELVQKAKNSGDFSSDLSVLKERHLEIVKNEQIEKTFNELEKLLKGISYTGEYSDKLYALIVSRGEYLSALILKRYLPQYTFWPSEKGIFCNGSEYLNARCNFQKTITPPVKSVVTGFYGLNENKEVCLFGRGGTDYTAGVLARITNAEKLEFWKNVDGFMTADPKIAKAQLIKKLSFEEASELSRFGAKILHPSALEPLQGTQTVVEIKNILKPSENGTKLAEKTAKNEIAAITGRKNLAVISVSGNEMVQAFGIASKILTAVADAGIPVDVIATAQANISFSVEEKDAGTALSALKSLENFEVSQKRNLALVGIVGKGIKGNPSFAAKIFTVLACNDIAIEMISQGASEIDLSLIVNEKNYEKAIQNIHNEFFGEKT